MIDYIHIKLAAISGLVLLCVASSCKKEPTYGVDPSLPGPVGLAYDSENSTDTDMAFVWNADAAIGAGARSFTVEVLTDAYAYDVNPDHRIVLASAAINDCASFGGYKKGGKYYVRARANYSGARYSEWVWLMDGEDKTIVKVGTGIVDPYEDLTPVTMLSLQSTRQLGINMSATNFKDRAKDVGYIYQLALYKDADGKDLQVAVELPVSLWDAESVAKPNSFPGFVFSGLKPGTDYWCKMTVIVGRNHPESELVKYSTLPEEQVAASSLKGGSAEVGDALFRENFDELAWGGNFTGVLPGVSRKDRASATSVFSPEGDLTAEGSISLEETDGRFNYCSYDTFVPVFTDMINALNGLGSPVGTEWGMMLENANGDRNSIAGGAGSVLVGNGSDVALLVSPELSGLRSSATVKLRFRACNYYDPRTGEFDPMIKSVRVFDSMTLLDASSNLYATTSGQEVTVSVMNDAKSFGWKDYEVTLAGVGPGTRIGIGGTHSEGISGPNRMLIDRIEAVLFKYDDEEIKPESRLAFASSRQLGIQMSSDPTWTVDDNVKYDYTAYLYKDMAGTDVQLALELPKSLWSTRHALNKEDHPGFVFGGLSPSTDYWFKVVCHHNELGDITSDLVRYTTLADTHLCPSKVSVASAQPGDILLREGFDDMLWFGNHVQALCGVSRKDRKAFDAISFPVGDRTGDNAIPTSEKPGDFNLVKWSNEVALSDIAVALGGTDSDFCREWGYMIEASGAAVNGLTCRAGSLKIGGSSKVTVLVAPSMPALKGAATVKVRFRACNYSDATKTTFDTPTKALFVFDDISIEGGKWNLYDKFYSTATKQEVLFDLTDSSSDYGWKDYEITLEHVLPTSHIGIGGTRAVVATGQNRFFLDNIEVELVKYE